MGFLPPMTLRSVEDRGEDQQKVCVDCHVYSCLGLNVVSQGVACGKFEAEKDVFLKP
jgi:hypothetical protein